MRASRKSTRALLPGALLVGAFVLLPAAPAAAQEIAAAEALFDRGLADMQAHRYEAGCKAIAESQRIDPRPGTLFTLATCEAEWGHVATAVTRYGDYLAVYDRLPDDKKTGQGERPKVAREQREKLAPEIPRLTLSLAKGAPAGTAVKRNGEPVADAVLGVALPLDPGEYTLSVQAPNGPLSEQRITLKLGEKREIVLEVTTALAPAGGPTAAPSGSSAVGPGSPPEGGTSGRRAATYAIGAAGLAGLAVGGILGGLVVGQKGTIDAHCGAGVGSKDDTACDQTGLDAANSARGLGLGSTIALAAGGAALGAAVVLFLTEPPLARGAGRNRGSWVSVGVLSAGPAGAKLGMEGAW